MKQKEIVDTAIENFTQLTGWQMDIQLTQNSIETDGNAILTHPDKKEKIKLLVEIKNELRAHDTFKLLSRNRKEAYLIIAQYISKPQRELLKVNNINYLDSSGNCFIHNQNFFVFIDNQKVQEQRQTKTNKLFTEKGMRLVYALLLNNDMISATYRHISDEVGIALGTVGNLLNELEAEGFVKTQNNDRQLKNKELLFEKWASQYDTTLRPHLFQKRFRFVNRQDIMNWRNINLHNAFWGGEPAAYLLDKFLNPQEFIIYSEKSTAQLMKELKLVPDIGGDIILMLPPLHNTKEQEMADPFLIYAELINSKDSRCLEAAHRIKEKYIDTKR
jgi:hypothetical protein